MARLATPCAAVRRRVDDYLDHELPANEVAQCDEHFHSCAACAARLDQARNLRTRLSALKTHPSDQSRARALAAFRQETARRRQRRANRPARAATTRSLLNELMAHAPADRQQAIQTDSRYHTPEVVEALIEESWARRYDDPRATLQLAELARSIADSLAHRVQGGAGIADLRARAWAHLANGLRIVGDLAAAEATLSTARRLKDGETANPLEQATILAFEAELRRAQRRFPEALRLFDQAARSVSTSLRQVGVGI